MSRPGFFASNSIQITIAISFLVVIVITVVFLGTTTLVLTRDALWETTTSYSSQLVAQVARRIDAYVKEMEDTTAVLLDTVPEGDASEMGLVQNTFATVARLRPDISLIGAVMADGTTLLHLDSRARNPAADAASQSWYADAVAAAGQPVYTGARIQNLLSDNYRWVVTVARARDATVLFVDLNFRAIEELARSVDLGARGYLFIMDAAGNIIYHPQQQLIFSNLFNEPIERLVALQPGEAVLNVDDEERLFIQREVSPTGWRVVSVTAVDQLLASQRRVRSYYFGWIALAVAVVMILTYFLSRRIAQPIMRLRRSMQAVEQGRFDIEIAVDSDDEIGALSRDFAITVAKINELMERSEVEQEEKRNTEIRALQHQITPHFLYNTLDSIVWMAEGGRSDQVVTMTTNLARLLRLSIGRDDAMVTLEDELDYLRSYLAIQQMRYRDRLTYVIECEDAALGCRLPRLTLQPMVENAIYHGIKEREMGGEVRIECRARTDDVEICIIDDGPGMDEITLAAIRSQQIEPTRGVGFKNVHRRLQLSFGPEYGLEVESSPGSGTTVRLRVPRSTPS